RQGPSCPGNMGQDRRARRAKFGTARHCRVATLRKGREASGARQQPEPTGLGLVGPPARSSVKRVEWRSHSGSRANQQTARERTRMYVTEPNTASHAEM